MRRLLALRDRAAQTGLSVEALALLPPSACDWLEEAILGRDEWVTWPLRRLMRG